MKDRLWNKKNMGLLFLVIVILLTVIIYLFNVKNNLSNNNDSKVNHKTEFKKENLEFFDDYLKPFQLCASNNIEGDNLNTKENYAQFVASYYIINNSDNNEYKINVNKKEVNNLLNKYFGEKYDNLELTKETYKIINNGNSYDITWKPYECGNTAYKIKDAKYNDTSVTVTYDIVDLDYVVGTKTITLKYEDNNYHVKSIKYDRKVVMGAYQTKEFFEDYLLPFNTCESNIIQGSIYNEDDIQRIVAFYYMLKNINSNSYKVSISKEEANQIVNMYFGNKSINLVGSKEGYTITEVNGNYEISWLARGCGYNKYVIKERNFDDSDIEIVYDIVDTMQNNKVIGSKILKLKYEDNHFRIKNITTKTN